MEARKFTYLGKEYPARITMNALREFRKETGEDFLKLRDRISGEDLGVMLWTAIRSQSRATGVTFDVTLDEFFDHVTPDEVAAWYNGTGEEVEQVEEGPKKKKRRG